MATRYWVAGGNGLWSSSTNWSISSGGSSGASAPGSADTVIFNASSGAGTATVDSNITIQTLTMTGFTGVLAFGTNTISVTNAGNCFIGDSTYSVTGTPVINVTYSGASAMTITTGSTTEANSVSFNITGGTYALTLLLSRNFKNLNFTGFSGSVSLANVFVYGDFTLSSTMTSTVSSNLMTFAATSGIKNITFNGNTLGVSAIFDGVGGAWKLIDAINITSSRNLTLTNGTLDLNSKSVTTGAFLSSNINTRTIIFGTSTITCIGTGTVWSMATISNLTISGTPTINISNATATATTVFTGAFSESQALSFNFTAGTYSLTFLSSALYTVKNVNFTGFAGTWAARSFANTIYGNLTLSTGMSVAASAGVLTFGATSGTQSLTFNGKSIGPFNVNGIGGTVRFVDDPSWTGADPILTNGTVDFNNRAIAFSTWTVTTGSVVIKNVSTTPVYTFSITQSSGTLTLGSNCAMGGTYTLTAGTLDLAGFQLTLGAFSSTNANVRTIAFGSGSITCNTTGGTLWTTATTTNLTVTGTPVVNISYSGALATTVSPGALSEANSISFNFTSGTYALTFLGTASHVARNVNFTGFSGTWVNRTTANTIYGNLTFSTGMNFNAYAGVLTFGATSGTQIITSNGKSFDGPVTVNGVGGTIQLADAMTVNGSPLTLTNGTLDLNGKTLTAVTSFATATGTKNLTFNAGTLAVTNATTTAWNNAAPTGFTTTAGTGTGKISMTAATAKTFVGGGSTYNCTLSNDGAGALTISGSNTFTTIANGVQPTQFIFTASTTQTITNWSVSGTSGNLVTITSTVAGTAATLTKSSGTVSADYLSLKDSAATGGATWYAGANSTNVSGNSGWIFSGAPTVTSSGFFFMMGM